MEEELANLRSLAVSIISSKSKATKEIAEKGLITLLRCRREGKALAHLTEASREETARGRGALEGSDLALQNLLYEKSYYEKEIAACRSFASAFSDDQIAMQPESEFWAHADPDLQAKARLSAHDLMIARLTYEMSQRKAMGKDLDALKAAKTSLLQSLANQEKTMKTLTANIKSLDETARPLQAVLSGGPVIKNLPRADLLPVALYVLCSQLAAAKDALGLPIAVSISGHAEEAESLAEASVAEGPEQGSDPALKRRKLPSSGDLYKAHPLAVDLDVFKADSGSSTAPPKPIITVRFQYLMSLRLVTAVSVRGDEVCSVGSEDNVMLASLFPLDDGLTAPTEALSQLEEGTFTFDPSRTAKPYKWCQHLAGIDLIPSLPVFASQLQGLQPSQLHEGLDAYRRQQRVVTVISRLQAAKEAGTVLNALLLSIGKNALPRDLDHYTRTPQSTVVSWEAFGAEGFGAGSKAVGAGGGGVSSTTEKAKKATTNDASALKAARIPEKGRDSPMEAKMGGAAGGAGDVDHEAKGEGAGAEEGEMAVLGDVEMKDAIASGLDEGEIPGTPTEFDLEVDDESAWDLEAADKSEPLTLASSSSRPEEEPSVTSTVKALFRLFKCCIRLHAIEVEATCKLFLDYPLRPPLFSVLGVREVQVTSAGTKTKAGVKAGKPIEAVNGTIVMEQQANLAGVLATPQMSMNETLLHQIAHLRLAVDEFVLGYLHDHPEMAATAAPGVAVGGTDLAAQLAARQQLRGRDRRTPAVVLPGPRQ